MSSSSNSRTHASEIYDNLREGILYGVYPARSKLNTRALSEKFNVGLSPLREALNRLSSEGWVLQTDRRGFSVVDVSVKELWDIHRARTALNEACLRDSIAHGDKNWEENLLLSWVKLSRQPPHNKAQFSEEAREWNRLHRAFHSSLISGGRSERLVRYCEQMFDETERYRKLGILHGDFDQEHRDGMKADEHKLILDAALERDADKAVKLLIDHFTETVVSVEKVLNKLNAEENAEANK